MSFQNRLDEINQTQERDEYNELLEKMQYGQSYESEGDEYDESSAAEDALNYQLYGLDANQNLNDGYDEEGY